MNEMNLEKLFPPPTIYKIPRLTIGSRIIRCTSDIPGPDHNTYMITAIGKGLIMLINPITGCFWHEENKIKFNACKQESLNRNKLLHLIGEPDLSDWEIF